MSVIYEITLPELLQEVWEGYFNIQTLLIQNDQNPCRYFNYKHS